MCGKVYHSAEGMKGHLLSFHGMKTQAEPVVQFVTPTIENKKNKKTTAQQSQIPELVEKKVEKTQGLKRKHKDKSPKETKIPKTDFSKSLNNVFISGNIQMRSLNLWSKKEKETNSPYQNNTQQTRHSKNAFHQPNQCEDESDQSLNNVSDCVSALSQNMIPQLNMSAQNTFHHHQSQIGFDLSETIHARQSDNRNKLNKMKAERRKKMCKDPECRLRGPCSEEDCGICQFCQNRNLK